MAPTPSKGLADVVAASTALSDIDGQAGRLSYRGFDIHDLAGKIGFAECVHLLQRGPLPTESELAGLNGELAAGREPARLVRRNIDAIAQTQAPMEAWRSYVSLSSAEDPDKDSNSPEAALRKAVRLTAQQPVLVALYHAARRGVTAPDPDPALGVAGNLLLQLTGERPAPRQA